MSDTLDELEGTRFYSGYLRGFASRIRHPGFTVTSDDSLILEKAADRMDQLLSVVRGHDEQKGDTG